ncbi:MAG: metal ABC transporter solute-binding protein, Zn/Mn family [Thermaurantimonas sp.]|uniref:metal ABC transporter solute-binding protein, Zn/Mn family n=1 Tax=Thermaurantimonas sp. TaxID=2681568 RepID=UPI00391C3E26
MKGLHWFILIIVSTYIYSCNSNYQSDSAKPYVVCTTTMIYDALSQILDTTMYVSTLMHPGMDPHTFKASAGDLKQLKKADFIIYNGLNLEGKFSETLDEISKSGKAIAVTKYLKESDLIYTDGTIPDPHIWFDIPLWQYCIRKTLDEIVMRFKNQLSAQEIDYIEKNAEKYFLKLTEVHHEALRKFDEIPQEQRVVITAHDAFNYFGRKYGVEVIGLQGISTASEFGLKDVIEMIHLITERKIPAIFVESTVSDHTVKAVIDGCKSKGHTLILGGTLYSDALGPKGSGHHTLYGAFRHNVEVIYRSLKTTY